MGMARTGQSLVFLDTNAILWLYAGTYQRFSKRVQQMIDTASLLYSPLSALEIQYLYELDKITQLPDVVIQTLQNDFDLQVSSSLFSSVIVIAIRNTWTRDVFDRVIVADAQINNALLITADKTIQKHYKKALI